MRTLANRRCSYCCCALWWFHKRAPWKSYISQTSGSVLGSRTPARLQAASLSDGPRILAELAGSHAGVRGAKIATNWGSSLEGQVMLYIRNHQFGHFGILILTFWVFAFWHFGHVVSLAFRHFGISTFWHVLALTLFVTLNLKWGLLNSNSVAGY